jgi:hypothetical protein
MASPRPNHAAPRRISPAEWTVRREESVKRIAELLTQGRKTMREIAAACHLKRETARGHMIYMETQGLAHRTGQYAGMNQEYWEGGEGPAPGEGVPAAAERREQGFVPKRPRVPAQQVGMKRHWMDVALFGPAQAVQQ